MAMPVRGDRVQGVYALGNKWRIRIYLGGRLTSEYRDTKVAAEQRAEQIRSEIADGTYRRGAPAPAIEAPPKDGESVDARNYSTLLWRYALAVARAPGDRDARQALIALAAASSAQRQIDKQHQADNRAGEGLDKLDRAELVQVLVGALDADPEMRAAVMAHLAEREASN